MQLSNKQDQGERLVSSIASLGLPKLGGRVDCAEDLMKAIVSGSDNKGRYFASPKLLACLFWWQETHADDVRDWRDQLVAQREISVVTIGRDCYDGSPVDIVSIVDPKRFDRFSGRSPIAKSTRLFVYGRDGWRCLWCGAANDLSIDHIEPVSKGGSDDIYNLQTLCRSCNSRKHNTDDAIARERVLGVSS